MFGVVTTILRGARRGTMTGKHGNKHFYKGRGANSTGFRTRKGGFIKDPYRQVKFIVPDLTSCPLKPYVSFHAAKSQATVPLAEDIIAHS